METGVGGNTGRQVRYRCSLCHTYGHNAKTCPTRGMSPGGVGAPGRVGDLNGVPRFAEGPVATRGHAGSGGGGPSTPPVDRAALRLARREAHMPEQAHVSRQLLDAVERGGEVPPMVLRKEVALPLDCALQEAKTRVIVAEAAVRAEGATTEEFAAMVEGLEKAVDAMKRVADCAQKCQDMARMFSMPMRVEARKRQRTATNAQGSQPGAAAAPGFIPGSTPAATAAAAAAAAAASSVVADLRDATRGQ